MNSFHIQAGKIKKEKAEQGQQIPVPPGLLSCLLLILLRGHLSIALLLVSLTTATAQVTDFRFIIDAPGPGYRDMAGTDRPQMDPTIPTQNILSFLPKDISTVTLMPTEGAISQIQISFRPESVQQIKEYIEFNKATPIRVEIGDYTLPLDIKKTLPWTTGVWLEARPTAKAKTILESLKKQK